MANYGQKATNTMRNNLNAAKQYISGATRAQFLLQQLHVRTGMTQQALLSRLVNYGYDNDPFFAEYRKEIDKEWQRQSSK